jgi:type I restriction enzyme S subunit
MTYLAVEAVQEYSDRWEWTPLRRLTRIRREANTDSSSRLLALSSDRGVEHRPDDGGRQLPSDATITGYWRVRPDDLVFNPMWAIGGGVAVSTLSGAVSTAYRIYEPGPSIWPRFLHYWLRSETAIEQYRLLVRGITTFDRSVTREDLDGMPIPVPPLATQRAIADYLDRETARIDALIAAKRRMVELLEDRFVRFVQSLVDPAAPAAPGDLIPLKYMAKIERGVFSHRPRNDPALYDGPYPFIQTGDVARARKYVESWTQTLNERGLAVSRKFPAGTLTMVIAANIGDVGITTFEACFPDSVVGIEANASVLDSNYLYFGLLGAKARLVEMAPVTTQANLNVERIGSLIVRCPSLEDQRAIANTLDAHLQRVDRFAAREGHSIELLQERRQALITAAVTGQLDIPEAE